MGTILGCDMMKKRKKAKPYPLRTLAQREKSAAAKDEGNPHRPLGWRNEALKLYLAREFTLKELAVIHGFPETKSGEKTILSIVQREALLELMRQRHADILTDMEEFNG